MYLMSLPLWTELDLIRCMYLVDLLDRSRYDMMYVLCGPSVIERTVCTSDGCTQHASQHERCPRAADLL